MQKPAKSNQTGVSADYSPDEILLEGNVKNSAFVLEIQDRLRNLGYLDKGGVDGSYAEMHRDKSMGQTASAILRFLQDHNIEPTGKVDILTFTALYQASPETTAGMLGGPLNHHQNGQNEVGTHFVIIYNNIAVNKESNRPIDSMELIREVYNYRRTKFKKHSNRYDREQAMAIDMLRLEIEKEQCKSSEE